MSLNDTRGDGAGYDIASFNPDASPGLIEAKTTGLKLAPKTHLEPLMAVRWAVR